MLPGVHDNPEHFQALAELSRRYPGLKGIQLLPYHNSGHGKYAQLKMPAPALETRVPSAEETNLWTQTLQRLGCRII